MCPSESPKIDFWQLLTNWQLCNITLFPRFIQLPSDASVCTYSTHQNNFHNMLVHSQQYIRSNCKIKQLSRGVWRETTSRPQVLDAASAVGVSDYIYQVPYLYIYETYCMFGSVYEGHTQFHIYSNPSILRCSLYYRSCS